MNSIPFFVYVLWSSSWFSRWPWQFSVPLKDMCHFWKSFTERWKDRRKQSLDSQIAVVSLDFLFFVSCFQLKSIALFYIPPISFSCQFFLGQISLYGLMQDFNSNLPLWTHAQCKIFNFHCSRPSIRIGEGQLCLIVSTNTLLRSYNHVKAQNHLCRPVYVHVSANGHVHKCPIITS